MVSRREVLGAIIAGGAAQAVAQTPPAPAAPGAYRGRHAVKPLPIDAAKLKGLSERLVRSHWENNYSGAVRALNAVEQRLDAMMKDKDLPPYIYGDLKREELIRTGSVVLHEHYFANLGGDNKAAGKALELIKQWWGGYDAWEAEFKRTANALGGGSGWVVLALNLHTGEAHNYWASDHTTQAVLGVPLLVLDMYEHAYHIDFGAAAARYVDAFMDNVNWEEVTKRAEWAAKAVRA
jgi:Fe-Mn family superoxide dismutase